MESSASPGAIIKTYQSKISYGILLPVLALLIGVMLLPVLNGAPLEAILTMAAVVLPTGALTLHLFFQTDYRLNDRHELLIRSGFLYNKVVTIGDIRSIRPTRNPLSAPAASLDRLELKIGKWEVVLISPEDPSEFIKDLKAINPAIILKARGEG